MGLAATAPRKLNQHENFHTISLQCLCGHKREVNQSVDTRTTF